MIHRKDHSIAVLAARIASVPEAVSRSLSELSRRRIIHSNRYTIHVLDAQKLGEIAQVDSLEF